MVVRPYRAHPILFIPEIADKFRLISVRLVKSPLSATKNMSKKRWFSKFHRDKYDYQTPLLLDRGFDCRTTTRTTRIMKMEPTNKPSLIDPSSSTPREPNRFGPPAKIPLARSSERVRDFRLISRLFTIWQFANPNPNQRIWKLAMMSSWWYIDHDFMLALCFLRDLACFMLSPSLSFFPL